jgi:ATPases involved in chromosome partitioning
MLAIAGGKGGVGKTTTALGFALDFAAAGRPALAVDADRDMPDLHVLARVPGRPTVAALVEDTNDSAERSLTGVARPVPDRPAAAVLPAAPGVDRATMRRVLRRVSPTDTTVVVDCPAGAGPDVADPLRLADGCVVVARPTPAGVRDGAKTAALSRAVDTPVVGCLLVGQGPTRRVERLLDAPVVAAPVTADPLSAPRVTRARRALLATVTDAPPVVDAPSPGVDRRPPPG